MDHMEKVKNFNLKGKTTCSGKHLKTRKRDEHPDSRGIQDRQTRPEKNHPTSYYG